MKNVKIPEVIYSILLQKANDERKNLEDVIVDLLISSLNGDKSRLYTQLSREYLQLATKLEKEGKLSESGEAYWKSLSYILRKIGSELKMDIENYHDYFSLIEYLSYRTDNKELIVDFLNSEKLHGEFHPRSQNVEEFKIRVNHLKNLLNILENINI
ncbi:PaREP1 family protein [Acidianus brierleyi]|uniref:PaREP1/PaREP8 domain-contain protein n=1 Tax=Acidianus brierleyi TaxID=41673 RepID=A0A2U9IBZ6_9CREN|nr:PaREP1 family protein [Acidianus brierleyi]AWR93545.1 hypothetical protein DFR85_01885 [Acidianus brierleyi]